MRANQPINTARIPSSYSKSSNSKSLREEIFAFLDDNDQPGMVPSPKTICESLKLPYHQYRNYVSKTKWEWKYYHRDERGSKCSSHGWRGWCFLPLEVSVGVRGRAGAVGWLQSRARNRWLLWRDRLGRLQWFETGRVNLYVRRPAKLGKAYQLLCNGFSFTGLITDLKVLEGVLAGVRFKGAHYVFPLGQRLPKLTVDLFQQSNGVMIKVGDESHPESLEVIATYPDWAERNERLISQLGEVLRNIYNLNGVESPDLLAKGQQKLGDYVR